MIMFSSSHRDSLLNQLMEVGTKILGIQGLILVGSGAYGYRDQYSDLDVVVVVKESNAVPDIHDEMVSILEKTQIVLKHKVYRHQPDIFVSCFLFNDYLELDLGVWSLEKLRATKSHWKVLFDKNAPDIEERLQCTISTNHVDLEQRTRESITFVWQFVRGAAVALSRGNFIKAVKEIDIIRDKIAELMALREGILHDVAKEISKVKSVKLQELVGTYEGYMDTNGVRMKLVTTVQLYFELVSEILGDEDTKYDYRIAMDMIEALTEL